MFLVFLGENLMYYNVLLSLWWATMLEKGTVITMRLSRRNLERIEAVRAFENIDRSTLLKEFIEDGLRRRVVYMYQNGKLTATRTAEILGISLREFIEVLEKEGTPVNWDSAVIKDYLKARYGE